MKPYFIAGAIIIVIAVGAYFFIGSKEDTTVVENTEDVTKDPVTPTPTSTTTESETESEPKTETEIGTSVEERPITAYHFGSGDTEILFVGGIHGGYSWNTTLVAYELMDYLKKNPAAIPENVLVTVIPALNPDGLYAVTGKEGRFTKSDVSTATDVVISGRFNANNVDLNRNFDCDWKTSGIWQNKTVSGGQKVFSEPESQAIRDYVDAHEISAVVTWYSSAGGVFASNCHNDISEETLALTNAFADASGYKAYENFDFYAITGDMMNWFAKNDIPAISVLLTDHENTEWSKNQKGVQAILKYYAD